MKLSSHILISAPPAALVARQAGPVAAACFLTGAILIDIDHYIFYIMRTGRHDPKGMFAWFEEMDEKFCKGDYYGINIFHTAEFFMLVALSSYFSDSVAWILLGMGLHLTLDCISLACQPKFGIKTRSFSFVEHYARKKRGDVEFWRG